jgi:histidinol-phosphate aminotransferase
MSDAVTFRPCIEQMAGYVPGAQPRGEVWAKLNANENPYPPSPKVLAALRATVGADLRLYPDAMATPLREKIARLLGLSPARVLVGNGSDDLLTMILRSFVGEGEMVIAPRPTYPLYDVLVDIQGARMEWADFPPDFALPTDLARRGARVTFLANPNSPSGTWIEPEDVARLAEQLEGVLVVDEAYVDFAEGDCTGLLDRFPHVIVLRSFSKSYSLAGVRIGYALASEAIIAGMIKVKDSYNVNRFAVAAGVAALDDIAHMRANAATIRSERERLAEALRAMDLFVYPSQANFVALRTGEPSPQAIAEALAAEGILVRTFAQPLLEDWVRVTVGTAEQNDRLLAILGTLVEDRRS